MLSPDWSTTNSASKVSNEANLPGGGQRRAARSNEKLPCSHQNIKVHGWTANYPVGDLLSRKWSMIQSVHTLDSRSVFVISDAAQLKAELTKQSRAR